MTENEEKSLLDIIKMPDQFKTLDQESAGTKSKSTINHGKDLYEQLVKPFAKNAAADPAVLRIDRKCAAGGSQANTTLKAIKQACLMYTQSPIPY